MITSIDIEVEITPLYYPIKTNAFGEVWHEDGDVYVEGIRVIASETLLGVEHGEPGVPLVNKGDDITDLLCDGWEKEIEDQLAELFRERMG